MRSFFLLLAATALAAGEYTTYIGDQNTWTIGQVLVDASGNTYVAGSRTFNLSYDPLKPQLASEAIVAKLDASGKTLFFAGIGGKGSEGANAIALDPAGNIYIGGGTSSPNFPVRNALYPSPSRGFIVKYNPTASDVLWATYFPEPVTAMAADASGVYVAGMTWGGIHGTTGLPNAGTGPRNYGAYLAKVSAAGDRIVYSTVISGSSKPCGSGSSCFTSIRGAAALGVGVDAAGNAYFGGNSDVIDLPATSGVLMPNGAGAWVAKVNASGTALAYLTYLTAGSVTVQPYFTPATYMRGFAVNAAGHVFVAGTTFDPQLPVTKGAYQTTFHGWTAIPQGPANIPPTDAFALELDANGTAVVWASYLGGEGVEDATTAALDPAGNFWVAGLTKSPEFPNDNGWSTGNDFLTAFNATGGLAYSGRYPTGTVKEVAVDSTRLLHIGEPGGVVSAIVPDQHPAVRPWFIGLYGGQIAPSEVISIYGPHIGGQPVTINGVAANILYSGDQQINLIVPPDIANQTTASVRVGNGPAFTAAVLPTIPQIFGIANEDGTVNTPDNPAKVGSVLSAWVSGFGAVRPGDTYFAGFMYANGQMLKWLYSGAAPGMPDGVGQINFIAPDSGSVVLVAGSRASDPFPISTVR